MAERALSEVALVAALFLGATAAVASAARSERTTDYDPYAAARAAGTHVVNREASVPVACYAKTTGARGACWTCHARGIGPHTLVDWHLQGTYAFAEGALVNHWTNVFVDRRAEVAAISEDAILRWVRTDNYAPLRAAIARRVDHRGFVPDLDFEAGFDDEGFARDGSGYRALRYKPFPGAFWPSNGSTDDVFIRLPTAFRVDATGRPSRAIARTNLALLELAVAASEIEIPLDGSGKGSGRVIDSLDEQLVGADLDGDGVLSPSIARVFTLPTHFVGGAHDGAIERFVYPLGTEFLHSVRYLDPDAPTGMAARMKELRYSRKVRALDAWSRLRVYERMSDEKLEGRSPVYAGDAESGLINDLGWLLQAFVEDTSGRLRLQTEEEAHACMGCHGGIGVSVDSTFAFPRKVPGAAGFRLQDLRGIPDAPQVGHALPEVATYFARLGGGDDFRANEELRTRLASIEGGDLAHLLMPSRARALLLDKVYLAIVRGGRLDLGREPLLLPATEVHARIESLATGLAEGRGLHRDGRLHLDWR